MAEVTEVTGSQRIGDAFAAARAEGRAALMPYMMAGYPDRETSLAVADAYAGAGADVVELGVPFSDPLADGPVIHAAATAALAAGTTLEDALDVCARIAARVPVVPMAYANMVLARGAEEFAQLLAGAGAVGAIVPDLPPEESAEVGAALSEARLALVPLVAPTTPSERLRAICAAAEGFVYVVSDTRVTGEREDLPPGLGELVEAVRDCSAVPVAVGFGIGTPQQAAAVGRIADGVIVGSRLVRAAREAEGPHAAASRVGEFIAAAKAAMAA
ncbi:MAG TPA: tryptophan synthase subunit alpha [Solirubrobacterales bacterium]|jgi:tryptophan synthase alpha chain|nr:tryptophan synthase subunit alpha [Solirubrobacterales bacterium]